MSLLRTFISISFPEDVVKEIARLQSLLSNQGFTGKLTELNNLHLTLKFLGEIEPDMIEKVKQRLSKIKVEPMSLKLGELGTFAHSGNPRIVWLKLEGPAIWDLQKSIDEILVELGFAKETRFMAHLTLARVKYVENTKGFREYVKHIKPQSLTFSIQGFTLVQSTLTPLGPIYTPLASFGASL